MYFRRIRDLCEDSDKKQRKLAEYLHIDQRTYSDYETGCINVSIEALMKLVDFYDTSIDYIVERTNQR